MPIYGVKDVYIAMDDSSDAAVALVERRLCGAGFFTYKAGVVGKTSIALFRDLSGKQDSTV